MSHTFFVLDVLLLAMASQALDDIGPCSHDPTCSSEEGLALLQKKASKLSTQIAAATTGAIADSGNAQAEDRVSLGGWGVAGTNKRCANTNNEYLGSAGTFAQCAALVEGKSTCGNYMSWKLIGANQCYCQKTGTSCSMEYASKYMVWSWPDRTGTCASVQCSGGKVSRTSRPCSYGSCTQSYCCVNPPALCSTFTQCAYPALNKGDQECPPFPYVCTEALCCRSQWKCGGSGVPACSGATPVSKGSNVKCPGGDASACTPSICCEAPATCAAFTCDGATPVSKGNDVQCIGNADTCVAATCCEAAATCATFACEGSHAPVNKGSNVKCPGNEDTCATSTCCEEPATCAAFTCDGATPVNKGSDVQCTGNADTCVASTCCEAAATTTLPPTCGKKGALCGRWRKQKCRACCNGSRQVRKYNSRLKRWVRGRKCKR